MKNSNLKSFEAEPAHPATLIKRCSSCKQLREAKHFYRDASKDHGLTSSCRQCQKARQQARNAAKKAGTYMTKALPETPEGTQRCSACKEIKELGYFHRSAGTKTGRTNTCKACMKRKYRRRKDAPARAEEDRKLDADKSNRIIHGLKAMQARVYAGDEVHMTDPTETEDGADLKPCTKPGSYPAGYEPGGGHDLQDQLDRANERLAVAKSLRAQDSEYLERMKEQLSKANAQMAAMLEKADPMAGATQARLSAALVRISELEQPQPVQTVVVGNAEFDDLLAERDEERARRKELESRLADCQDEVTITDAKLEEAYACIKELRGQDQPSPNTRVAQLEMALVAIAGHVALGTDTKEILQVAKGVL